uniref:Uncharacterized protein n=1 Tax=Opuntia streptacantha TaxID=393608 RepID=A0A7C9EEK6_OPUST
MDPLDTAHLLRASPQGHLLMRKLRYPRFHPFSICLQALLQIERFHTIPGHCKTNHLITYRGQGHRSFLPSQSLSNREYLQPQPDIKTLSQKVHKVSGRSFLHVIILLRNSVKGFSVR